MSSYERRGYVTPIGINTYSEHTLHEVTVSVPRVKWKWLAGDSIPSVHVFKTMKLGKGPILQWEIRYPEEAPPGARYEILLDKVPNLTPEQEELLAEEKAKLIGIWKAEDNVLNRLLSLWPPPPESERVAVAQDNRDRYIEYTNSIYVEGAPFNIKLEVTIKYTDVHITKTTFGTFSQHATEPYKVTTTMYLQEGDTCINLATIKLPIVKGNTSATLLIKYLMDNPLISAGHALSNVGEAMSKVST